MTKLLPNQKYACPHCNKPLVKHNGPWDVYHCFVCYKSVDMWFDKIPDILDGYE